MNRRNYQITILFVRKQVNWYYKLSPFFHIFFYPFLSTSVDSFNCFLNFSNRVFTNKGFFLSGSEIRWLFFWYLQPFHIRCKRSNSFLHIQSVHLLLFFFRTIWTWCRHYSHFSRIPRRNGDVFSFSIELWSGGTRYFVAGNGVLFSE